MAVCTVAPTAWVSRSGVLAIGMDVDPPAADAFTTSAPPSTEPLSTTTQDPEVNEVPAATVSVTAP